MIAEHFCVKMVNSKVFAKVQAPIIYSFIHGFRDFRFNRALEGTATI